MRGIRVLVQIIVFLMQIGTIGLAIRRTLPENRFRTAISLLTLMRARA